MSNVRIGSVETRVRKLARDAVNLKTAQFAGSDSIRSYVIETTREWDFSYTPTFVSGQTQEYIHIYVKFIADHQNAPFAKPIMKILIDDTNYFRVGTGGALNEANADFSGWTNGWVPDVYGNYSPTNTPNAINEKSWYNAIGVVGVHNIKIKLKIYSTDSGRIIAGYDHNDGKGLFIS